MNEFQNPIDTEGYCMTKFGKGKKACLMGSKLWKKTFIDISKRFQLGPVPVKASIKLNGKYGADYGIGLMKDCTKANKKRKKAAKKRELAFLQQSGTEVSTDRVSAEALMQAARSKKKKSGKCKPTGGDNFHGFLVMVSPYAQADLTVSASVDAYVVAAGVAAEVTSVRRLR